MTGCSYSRNWQPGSTPSSTMTMMQFWLLWSKTHSWAETAIVGSVPDNYTYFSNGADMEQNAEDYIMNNG